MPRTDFERYLDDASDASLENATLVRLNEIAKLRRTIMAEIDRAAEAIADVKVIERERDRRKRLLKVVESRDKKEQKAG